MTNIKQLWSFANDNCLVPPYGLDGKGIEKIKCKNAPIMHWPDGSICWVVTSWLLVKFMRLSRNSARGGSAGTYAGLLSHFVRFIYEKQISFTDLSDEHFYEWAEVLKTDKDFRTGVLKRRENTQVGRIMRKGIEFLLWYQKNRFVTNVIVGTRSEGGQIKVTLKKGKRGKYTFSYYDHPAIPKNNVPEDVKPIGHGIITSLYDAISRSSKSPYLRKRRQQLLKLLEATGGRRIEVAELQISDVEQALKSERLKMRTAKTQTDNFRQVPIAKEWLEPVMLFINTHRKALIERLIQKGKLEADPGYLFLSETTGKPLSEETITKEISILRALAGIDEKTCAHMFRHRFITLQVIYRLKSYIGQELPMELLQTILTKVSSITGHKNPISLMPYIDLAFQEMGVWDTAEKVLMLRSKAEAAFRQIQTLAQDVEDGVLKGKAVIEMTLDILKRVVCGLSEIRTNDQGMLQV